MMLHSCTWCVSKLNHFTGKSLSIRLFQISLTQSLFWFLYSFHILNVCIWWMMMCNRYVDQCSYDLFMYSSMESNQIIFCMYNIISHSSFLFTCFPSLQHKRHSSGKRQNQKVRKTSDHSSSFISFDFPNDLFASKCSTCDSNSIFAIFSVQPFYTFFRAIVACVVQIFRFFLNFVSLLIFEEVVTKFKQTKSITTTILLSTIIYIHSKQ